ncbi:MAG TPA: T9SS type A sorting domain-containing protein [Chitinophagales bacterium]|nr:T9SS type A sorting domain-containing protein [Chitinophagales bacterium]
MKTSSLLVRNESQSNYNLRLKSLSHIFIILFFAIVVAGLTNVRAQDTWTQKSNVGGPPRDEAVGFSIGSKGYIGTGFGSSYLNDFWEYDPATNAWTQKANFGGTPRCFAIGFSIGSKGYIGTGTDGSYRNDFWEYDPATNAWTQKANFGGTPRGQATGFSIGSKGYIGTGLDGIYKNDFWEYDPASDSWTQKTNFGGTARRTAVGFSIGSKGYLGTGFDGHNKNDFWEYDPASNAWTQKADFGAPTKAATGFSIGAKGYVCTGNIGSYSSDFWEYDPVSNAWSQKAEFAGPERYYAAGFSIGNKGYIGTGYYIYNDFYEYTTSCVGQTFYADADNDGYGNAANTLIDCIAPTGYVADNTDCNDADAAIHPNASDICNSIDDNCNGVTDENAITATITPSGSVSTCSGVAITLTANAGAGISYQWLKNSATIPGATNATYSLTKAAGYQVSEINNFSCASTSAVTTLSVISSPAATISYTTLDLCGQSSITLTANSGSGLTYQWLKGGNNISGATNQTYITTTTGTYKVVVTKTNGGCSKTSAGVKVVKTCKESSGSNGFSNAEMNIYPNPTTGTFTFDLKLNNEENEEAVIQVLNMMGQVVYDKTTTVANGVLQKEIQLSDVANGVYLVKVTVNGDVYSAQISYQK